MKRLYRSDTNKIVAGIIGGVGEYFSLDPALLRVVWILILVFTGVVPGLLVYVIAILIIPRRPPHVVGIRQE